MTQAELDPVLVVIPTYNEIGNLEAILGRLRSAAPDAHALVVDDNSPDGTGECADKLAADDDRIHVLHREEKAGLGAAYLAGFKWGLDRGYQVLVEMDADGSHAPEELNRLLSAFPGADLVVGSRYVAGGKVENWAYLRRLLSRGASLYTRIMLRFPARDATAGFRAYRAEVLRTLPLSEITSQGYCFQIDLYWRAWCAGFRVVEVPITFTERLQGKSKMHLGIITEALWRVLKLGLTNRTGALRKQALAARSMR